MGWNAPLLRRLIRVPDLWAGALLILIAFRFAPGPVHRSPFFWMGAAIAAAGILARVARRTEGEAAALPTWVETVLALPGAEPEAGGPGVVITRGDAVYEVAVDRGVLRVETTLPAAPDPPFLIRSLGGGAYEALLLGARRSRLSGEEVGRVVRAVKDDLDRASDASGGATLEAIVARRRIAIQKHALPTAPADVEALIGAVRGLSSMVLMGRPPGLAGAGIEILGAGAPAGAPSCPVCGDAVRPDESVRCPACDTPHHRECWEFHGRCATYGCRGTGAG